MLSRTQDRPAYDLSRFALARWSIFAILIFAYMLVFFHRMAPAVVAADLMRTFGITGAALGSLAAMCFYVCTLMQIPASAGMAVGLVNTGLFLGAAGMQPLFGWATDLLWQGTVVNSVRVYATADYRLGFLLMCGCALLAVAGAVRVRETHCRNQTVRD